MTRISSRDNPKLRWLRRLAESRGKRRLAARVAEQVGRPLTDLEDLVLLEGPHLIDAALGAEVEVLQVFASTVRSPSVSSLQARLQASVATPEWFEVEEELLHAAVEAETSQGICALAVLRQRTFAQAPPTGRIAAVWLDQLRDPGNVGAVLRVAEAAGATAVGLSSGSASWRHPRALRASAGSALRLTLRTDLQFASFRKELDTHYGLGCRWIGLSARGQPLRNLLAGATDRTGPIGIALGSESHGLTADVERACEALGAIEMAPPVESLNVAVAAGIALYLCREGVNERTRVES